MSLFVDRSEDTSFYQKLWFDLTNFWCKPKKSLPAHEGFKGFRCLYICQKYQPLYLIARNRSQVIFLQFKDTIISTPYYCLLSLKICDERKIIWYVHHAPPSRLSVTFVRHVCPSPITFVHHSFETFVHHVSFENDLWRLFLVCVCAWINGIAFLCFELLFTFLWFHPFPYFLHDKICYKIIVCNNI